MGDKNYSNQKGWGQRPLSNSKQEEPTEKAKKIYNQYLSYNSKWIVEDTDDYMVKFVEKAGELLAENGLKSSKIRSVYGEIKRIEGNIDNNLSQYYLLKPKVAYAVGRDKNVIGLQLFKIIFDNAYNDINGNSKNFIRFCEFMEAIIAYHKFYVKSDK